MNRYDSVSSVVWFVVGLGIISWSLLTLEVGTLRSPKGGWFPLVSGAMICILSMIVFIQAQRKKQEATGERLYEEGSGGAIFGTIGILIVYALALERLGFVVTTFLVMAFIFIRIARASWLAGVIESTITTGICYYVFHFLLRIPLPKGLLHM